MENREGSKLRNRGSSADSMLPRPTRTTSECLKLRDLAWDGREIAPEEHIQEGVSGWRDCACDGGPPRAAAAIALRELKLQLRFMIWNKGLVVSLACQGHQHWGGTGSQDLLNSIGERTKFETNPGTTSGEIWAFRKSRNELIAFLSAENESDLPDLLQGAHVNLSRLL